MLDIQRIKDQPQAIQARLAQKGYQVDFTKVLQQYQTRKQLLIDVETVQAEINQLSSSVPQVKQAGGDVQGVFQKVKALKQSIEEKQRLMKTLEVEIDQVLLAGSSLAHK
jgi:seryl-tRNA synthetase